jgi:hypothetical protein
VAVDMPVWLIKVWFDWLAHRQIGGQKVVFDRFFGWLNWFF